MEDTAITMISGEYSRILPIITEVESRCSDASINNASQSGGITAVNCTWPRGFQT